MPEMTLNTLAVQPNGFNIYVFTVTDIVGVVAANTYYAFFNPANSTKVHVGLSLSITCYSTGSSTTPNSMQAFRTSATSGGTLASPQSAIGRFMTSAPDPQTLHYTANPTVTTTSALPIGGWPPAISTGTGTSNSLATPPPGQAFTVLPGQGVCFKTAAGNINQMWGFTYIWGESGIDSVKG